MVPPKSIKINRIPFACYRNLDNQAYQLQTSKNWFTSHEEKPNQTPKYMLILVAFLIEILYVKASSKYFYNLTNTIIKQRKLQRFASLKKEEKNWNFEEMEKQSKGSLWK